MRGMPQAETVHQTPTVHDLPVQMREAQLVPATFNADEKTVEVVWTTGARVRRYDWYNDTPYEEELVVDDTAADMSRFEAGTVQVLDGHRSYGGVAAILGIATRGWISGKEGRATLRLSERPELAGIVSDIQRGIIRAISFGYAVRRYEITPANQRDDGVNMPLYRATSWQPQEISFVPVPADANAGTRSERSAGGSPCEFHRASAQANKETVMPAPIEGANTEAEAQRAAAEQASRAAEVQAATQRAADITALCQRHNVGHLAADLIRGAKPVAECGTAVLEELARRDAARGGHQNTRVETVVDEQETRLRGMEEAVLSRVDPKVKLTDNGRQYRGLSLVEMGRDFLLARGVSARGMSKMEVASAMMAYRTSDLLEFRAGSMTVSDFPSLMANVANKRLRSAYDDNAGTYTIWARKAPNAPDFKNISVVQLSGAPDLLKTNEHGEFTYGTMTDGAESYAVLTYGRIVSLTRQAIVNDDLRGFDRLVAAYGNSARRLENRLVYSRLTTNAVMADGVALFAAGHSNLATGAGSALQFSSLTTMRAAMRVQKGYQNEELNLVPSYLIVPAALEQTAYQLTSTNYVPATKAEINEFREGGRTALTPVVEPILDATSATAWYAAASNGQIDTVEYCYLDGAEGPVIESEMGFEVDGMSWKCRLDFAAKDIDYRGLYKANGV